MNYGIIPSWKTATHQPILYKFLDEAKLTPLLSQRQLLIRYHNIHLYFIVSCIIFFKLLIFYIKGTDRRELKINDINIGHSLNESAIVGSGKGFATLGQLIKKTITSSIILFELSLKFSKKQIKLVIGGDEPYIEMSIAYQLAKKHDVPTRILKGFHEFYLVDFDAATLAQRFIWENKTNEVILTQDEISSAEQTLERAVAGSPIHLPFMPVNLVHAEQPSLDGSGYWIYLHDFFDSPGVYGENLFVDHLSWCIKTIDFLLSSDCRVYVKTHPNARPGNKKIYEFINEKYGNKVIFINENVSLNYLTRQSLVDVIISVFGSVIPEALFCGIPVVVAGRSPYTSLGMINRPASQEEYFERLLDLDNYAVINKEELVKKFAIMMTATDKVAKVNLPHHDCNETIWDELNLGKYPETIHLRREKYLYNEELRRLMKIKLEKIDLLETFRLSVE